jgi:hypothetical protein
MTRDPVRQDNCYLEAARSAGARVNESGMTGSSRTKGGPVQDWSGHVTAFLGDDRVKIVVGEVMWLYQGIGAKTPAGHTGIAIRYSVPQRSHRAVALPFHASEDEIDSPRRRHGLAVSRSRR